RLSGCGVQLFSLAGAELAGRRPAATGFLRLDQALELVKRTVQGLRLRIASGQVRAQDAQLGSGGVDARLEGGQRRAAAEIVPPTELVLRSVLQDLVGAQG